MPEQLDRACLSVESRGEAGQDLLGDGEHAPESPDRIGVVGAVDRVRREWRAVAEVKWLGVDLGRDPKLVECRHQVVKELRTCWAAAKFDRALVAIARDDAQAMVQEVEDDLDVTVSVRHRPGREAQGVGQERDVPPVVAKRHERHSDLADDLRVAVKRLLRRLPVRIRKGRPATNAVRAHRPVRSVPASYELTDEYAQAANVVHETSGKRTRSALTST